MKSTTVTIGWREWVGLPELGVPGLKVKVDTGARTSCLHADKLQEFERNGEAWIRFWIKPLRQLPVRQRICEAPIHDMREVSDSGGHRQVRYVILTDITVGGNTWKIEMTLNNRRSMKFRMLLGRTAMDGRLTVDPAKSFTLGRMKYSQLLKLYPEIETPHGHSDSSAQP